MTQAGSFEDDLQLRQAVSEVAGVDALFLTFGEIDPEIVSTEVVSAGDHSVAETAAELATQRRRVQELERTRSGKFKWVISKVDLGI